MAITIPTELALLSVCPSTAVLTGWYYLGLDPKFPLLPEEVRFAKLSPILQIQLKMGSQSGIIFSLNHPTHHVDYTNSEISQQPLIGFYSNFKL